MIDIKDIVQVLGFVPMILFVGLALYFTWCLCRLTFQLRRDQGHRGWLPWILCACVAAWCPWSIGDLFVVNGLLGGSPLEGHREEGRFYLAKGRGEFMEVSQDVWTIALVTVLVTSVLVVVTTIAFAVALLIQRFARNRVTQLGSKTDPSK